MAYNFNLIKTTRKASNLTVAEFCKTAGISKSAYYNFIDGKPAQWRTADKILKSLKISWDDFDPAMAKLCKEIEIPAEKFEFILG